MFYASDLITQYLPWYALVQQHLRQFTLPHFVPNLYSTGYPLLAEGETGVLSPINALILFFFPFSYAVTLLYFAYALIAIAGTYLFLRRYGLTNISSLLGGLVFTFSGFMLSRYFQPSIIFAAALLPWGMALTDSYLLPIIIYLQITAGHLQIALISSLAYIFMRLRFKTLMLIALGFGLSAFQLLPSFKLYQLSDRQNWDPMVRFTYSLPPPHLITYFFPDWFGISAPGDNLGFTQFGGSFWEFNLTIWTLPFLLSLLPLIFKPSRHILILYILWAVFLILSFGGYTPLYRFLAHSPQFPFRAPSRFLFIATFAASTLAAIGFHSLARRRPLWRQLAAFFLIIFSVIWQLTQQLKDYFVFSSGSIGPASTTPLPFNPNFIPSPPDFVVKFHQGLVISLITLATIFYVKTHHPRRLADFTHRR